MNQQSITTRIATEKDAALVADISRETFHTTFASQNTPENMDKFMNTQFAREKLMAELSDPENIFLLAYYGKEVAGYAKLRDSEYPEHLENSAAIEIVRIYSIASMIGKGVGRVLMQTCIDIARKRGKAIVWLGVWEKNQRAIDFYNSWGFEKFGEHDFVLGNDVQRDWLMKKHIL
jgi:diamine N-acetyltransferase